jgi:hypothetical protein
MSASSANNPVPTLSALMQSANAQWRVYDMGRIIQPISKADFTAIENGQKPYPYPIQKKARFAMVFWDQETKGPEAKANPFIWFLQFDLDEIGLLNLQQRDHYISLVIKELGSKMLDSSEQQSTLDNHPYSFTPDQNRQAAFNAKVKVALKQPASMHYEHVQAYFAGQIDADKWQELTVQGIADFSARIDQANNERDLINHLSDLSVQTLCAIGATLEHEKISLKLTNKLTELQDQALAENDSEQVLNLLRCLVGSPAERLVLAQLKKLLASAGSNEETLFIVIVGRFWQYFEDKEFLHLFFEKAATNTNKLLFSGLFIDLVAIPSVREHMLGLLRDPSRPETISVAISTVFGKQPAVN